jgi:N-acetylmuramoyl-L-alanine amidase
MVTLSDAPSAFPKTSSKRICLDAGHGGSDPGAVFQNFREKDIALAVILQVKAFLETDGFNVTLTRGADITVSLAERCRISNDAKADIFMSVHLNADPDPDMPGMQEASGAEVWHFASSERSRAFAEGIAEKLRQSLIGRTFRGTKATEHLYVLKNTRCPAALVEVGFVDSRRDAELLTRPDHQVYVAQLLATAVKEYLRRA